MLKPSYLELSEESGMICYSLVAFRFSPLTYHDYAILHVLDKEQLSKTCFGDKVYFVNTTVFVMLFSVEDFRENIVFHFKESHTATLFIAALLG
jgi:hypothetical protein